MPSIPPPPGGDGSFFSGFSATIASVVITARDRPRVRIERERPALSARDKGNPEDRTAAAESNTVRLHRGAAVRPRARRGVTATAVEPRAGSSAREILAGLVERVTFHNADNGFCVLRTKARAIAIW